MVGIISTDMVFRTRFAIKDPYGFFNVDCFYDCVEQHVFQWTYLTVFSIGNPLLNFFTGYTGRMGIGGVPSHATTWMHRFGGWLATKTGYSWFGYAGRALGRLALIPTIIEGFYDWGVISYCTYKCWWIEPDCEY